MGSSQSIPSTSEITDAPLNVSNVKEYTASTKNGPKTKSMDQTNLISVTIEDESIADSDASIVSTDSDDYSSDEEEADEYLTERRKILEEARGLRQVAEYFYHPEAPVASTFAVQTRCFFSRYSAPDVDPNEEEEREQVLEDAKNLKELAGCYMHPEKPVVSSDAMAFGRNYFTRPSAPEFEEEEDMEERERILEEMKQLKTTADWYMHPEKPVAVDATACGRNYFSRPSAEEEEDEDMADERERVMEDMKALKMAAEWYMHPEKPVAVDSTACGRNYFSRPLAFDDEAGAVAWEGEHLSLDFKSNYSVEMEKERKLILAEANQLKEVASWYLQPEKPVAVDSTACGRNYFSRPLAFDDEAGAVAWEGEHLSLDFKSNYSVEMEKERKLILAEANQLKEVASWYLQPEKPVTVDSTACGRNYFSRASAPEQEDVEDIEERELILAEVNELRMVAEWYQHPEKEVTVYATASGRNYFDRPSAPVEEDPEERKEILADAAELLKVAQWYMHPEVPVTVYATSCGRNYFTRPSVSEYDDEMEEERLRILEEMKQLKTTAEWYLNPEKPVAIDGISCGRNYFSRPSAPEYEEDAEERDQVLADVKELKEVAGWYANPEQPVKSDGFATARSYFTRPSAPEREEDDSDERIQIIAEAKELKEVAGWYLQPEKPVAVDPAAFGRNFFTRPSSVSEENEEQRLGVLADATELKNLAVDYLHPEKPVAKASVNCARNYFNRPSATGHTDYIHSEGYANHSDLHNDYVQHGYDYDHHDMHHDCDVSQQSFHSQSDHFDMDEDLHGFRESITAFHDGLVGTHDPHHIPMIKEEDDGKEGNLSRSPSSIMLFDDQVAV